METPGEQIADPVDHGLGRETATLAFYTLITLAAELATLSQATSRGDAVAALWATAIGLGLAHWYATTLSTTLVHHGVDARQILLGLRQVATTSVVAAALTLPFLVLPAPTAFVVARWEVTLGSGGVAYLIAVRRGASRATALASAGVALAIGLTVILVKAALVH